MINESIPKKLKETKRSIFPDNELSDNRTIFIFICFLIFILSIFIGFNIRYHTEPKHIVEVSYTVEYPSFIKTFKGRYKCSGEEFLIQSRIETKGKYNKETGNVMYFILNKNSIIYIENQSVLFYDDRYPIKINYMKIIK